MMASRALFNSVLSTSDGKVSSTRILGPVASGPNAHMLRAANKSQSYFVWKNSPRRFLQRRVHFVLRFLELSWLDTEEPRLACTNRVSTPYQGRSTLSDEPIYL